MPGLSAPRLLDVWEQGQRRTPSARALLALRAAAEARGDGSSNPGPEVTGPGREPHRRDPVADLPVCRRDAALLELLVALSPASGDGRTEAADDDPTADAVTTCPGCGDLVEVVLPLGLLARELAAAAGTETEGAGAPVTVRHEGYAVACRAPSAAVLASVPAGLPAADATRWLLTACVEEATSGGVPVEPADLPAPVVAAVGAALAASPSGQEAALSLRCPGCGDAWVETLDPVPFVWRRIEEAATALVSSVHALAAAYGWSEAEILALSAARRALYLRMLDEDPREAGLPDLRRPAAGLRQ